MGSVLDRGHDWGEQEPEEAEMRLCTSCSTELPHDAFYSEKAGKFGLRSKCKQCMHVSTILRRERKKKPRSTVAERFCSKIVKLDVCWRWTAGVSNGYGIF